MGRSFYDSDSGRNRRTYAVIHYDKPNPFLIAIAIPLAFLVIFIDIRHAGMGMGIAALLFQIVMARVFVFLLLVLALRLVINTATHRNGRQILAFAGGAEAARLFFVS